MSSTALGGLLTAGLLFAAVAYGTALVLVAIRNLWGGRTTPWHAVVPIGVHGGAAVAVWLAGHRAGEVALPLAAGLVASVVASRALPDFARSGQALAASYVLLSLFGVLWGAWFLATAPLSGLTRGLLLAAAPLVPIALPQAGVQAFEQWEVFCRRTWRRPRQALPATPRGHYPKISIHVPAHAEPPAVVIATLEALARLRYPNFEVLVIDNNTEDPALWRPVATHCRRLGERFRFFHLESWPGAKAGALNYALTQTAPDAELIAVVDADYHAEPHWLDAVVGFFDDPAMGFVQPPHDYRDWEGSAYLRMCYWEYRSFFLTTLVGLNERDAAITVGTMCVLRREAVERAGGWAEWCATEDSELAIRIHALGYTSVYLTESLGRGLIPETFAGYKTQRIRWSCGPVQELKRHYRLCLPTRWSEPSALSAAQKVHHLNHGLHQALSGVRPLLAPLGLAIAASMIVQGETIAVPAALWLAATVTLAAGGLHWWLTGRVAMRCSLRDTLAANLASKALAHAIAVGSLQGLFARRVPWIRTNKFRALPAGLGALAAARTELLLGLGGLLGVLAALLVWSPRGLVLMLVIGVAMRSTRLLAAPVVALSAERDLRARERANEFLFTTRHPEAAPAD